VGACPPCLALRSPRRRPDGARVPRLVPRPVDEPAEVLTYLAGLSPVQGSTWAPSCDRSGHRHGYERARLCSHHSFTVAANTGSAWVGGALSPSTMGGANATFKLGLTFSAGSSYDDSHPFITGVVVCSHSTHHNRRGGTRGNTPCRHDSRLLGPTNLAPSTVHPTATDASQSILSWNIGVRRVGSGCLSTTANPDRHILRPEGPPSPLLGPWSAVTTTEKGTANQASSPSSRSETLASRSKLWRGAAVHATLFLGCTDFCGGIRR
jgi:hypothetical protein